MSRYQELEVFGEDDITLCDVVGLQIKAPPEFYSRIASRDFQSCQSRSVLTNLCKYYVNRDKGIYDTLPYAWKRLGNSPKKELFDVLNGGEATSRDGVSKVSLRDASFVGLNAEQAFAAAVEQLIGAKVLSLAIEVADVIGEDKYRLGGAAVIGKVGTAPSSARGFPASFDGSAEQELCTVKVHMDEAILLACGLGKPVYMSKELFDGLAMDASLSKTEAGAMLIQGATPRFAGAEVKRQSVQRAWDIFDPKRFLAMSSAEKRAVLRASGVNELPRPREGEEALDRALAAVMDDSVRREFLRLSAAGGTEGAGSKLSETEEQEVLRLMGEALENGDMETAQKLREQFANKRALKADPTQVSVVRSMMAVSSIVYRKQAPTIGFLTRTTGIWRLDAGPWLQRSPKTYPPCSSTRK